MTSAERKAMESEVKNLIAYAASVAPDQAAGIFVRFVEDHMNTARIAVTAAFCKGIPNYLSFPPEPPIQQDITLYHALPYGLTDGLRKRIMPDFYVDITTVVDQKEHMLACHESQKNWLDKSQGLNAYLITMREMSEEVGNMSGKFHYAEGWRRHSHLGYSRKELDPLRKILEEYCHFPLMIDD